ncbi:MAG: histidyl-tRNA synthetase [Blastocatellia bacterium]|nr:histidyl-tRNA synthetase [Blastocatellia bacterium]
MTDPLSKIPSGMRYYSGSEAQLRREIEDTVMQVFLGWSYDEITTPLVDYYALFERGMGTSEATRSFRFVDNDGRMLALRPDVTSLVARAASTLFARKERPLRLSYAAPVLFQRPLSHAEWRRESMQIGCELIGSSEGLPEVEMIAIVLEILKKLGFESGLKITLNNVEIFNGIAENLGMDPVARSHMRTLVDLRDSAELERFLRRYTDSKNEREVFARLTQLAGRSEIIAEALQVIDNARSVKALKSLDELWKVVERLGFSEHCEVDLGDVSGLDYYTGTVFKVYISGAGARVGSGGRYDNLIGNFGSPEPAIGFVIDLDAITDLMGNGEKDPDTARAITTVSGSDATEMFSKALYHRKLGETVRLSEPGAAI